MAIELVNVGLVANDGTGTPLRDAFIRVNRSLTDLDLTKAQVFYSEPTHPYNVNDLYITSERLYVCVNASTGAYQLTDWDAALDISSIVTSHGDLINLGEDDHLQYFNITRGDARYSLIGHDHSGIYSPIAHTHTGVYAPIIHTHLIVDITDYVPGSGADVSDWFEIVNPGLPNEYLRCKKPFAGDYEIQAWTSTGWLPPTIWESMPLATSTSIGGIQLGSGNTLFLREDGTWQEASGGAVYPPAGIPVSNGIAWGASITNNSANWNTAYGWGDHAGLYAPAVHNHDDRYFTETEINSWFELVGTAPNQYIRCKFPFAGDYEIQAWSDTGWLPPTIWESMPLATSTTVGGIQLGSGATLFLREDGTWQTVMTGSSMVYPGAGIALSTGSAWGTSITNNSANWNTAYGWGNHASAGYLTSQTSHADVVVDGDFTSQGIMLRDASAGIYSILTNNSTNWNTAYGWGNHAGLYRPISYVPAHNDTTSKQGGATGEYYHLIANIYNSLEYVPNGGSPYLRIKLPIACDYEIQAWSDFSQFPPTIWESMPLATSTSVGGIQLGSGSSLFLREDGTWQAASGASVSFGLSEQIPYTNTTVNNFLYSSNFSYDASEHTLNLACASAENAYLTLTYNTVPSLRLGASTVGGTIRGIGITISGINADGAQVGIGMHKSSATFLTVQDPDQTTPMTYAFAVNNSAGTGLFRIAEAGDVYILDLAAKASETNIVYYDSTTGKISYGAASSGGVTDHGALTGLGDDDHTQYYNQTRGDARYSLTTHNHAATYEPIISKSTGYLRYTGSAWEFKNETYALSSHTHAYIATTHTVNSIINGTGFLKNNGSGTWSWDNNTYVTGSGSNTRIAYWSSGSNITSNANLTYDGAVLTIERGIKLTAPSTSGTGSGIRSSFTAGEALAFGNLVYMKSDGKVWKAAASGITTTPVMGMCMGTVSANGAADILLSGRVYNSSWSLGTGGDVLYLTTSGGSFSVTAPSGVTGYVVQVIGVVLSATTIYFNPSLNRITLA